MPCGSAAGPPREPCRTTWAVMPVVIVMSASASESRPSRRGETALKLRVRSSVAKTGQLCRSASLKEEVRVKGPLVLGGGAGCGRGLVKPAIASACMASGRSEGDVSCQQVGAMRLVCIWCPCGCVHPPSGVGIWKSRSALEDLPTCSPVSECCGTNLKGLGCSCCAMYNPLAERDGGSSHLQHAHLVAEATGFLATCAVVASSNYTPFATCNRRSVCGAFAPRLQHPSSSSLNRCIVQPQAW